MSEKYKLQQISVKIGSVSALLIFLPKHIKNNQEKSWTVASRKSKDILEGIYLENKKDKVDAVIICAYHKQQNKLVIIKEFRVPINKYIYELPAGLVDSDDDNFEETVIRELKEETGLNVIEIKKDLSSNQVYLSPGMTDESAAFVYCICDGEVSKDYLEDDEDIEAILISQDEAKDILKNSSTPLDIRVYLALQSFALMGEKMFL